MDKAHERHDLTALEQLEQIRDTLRVQAHLFKAEMKDEWEEVESKWSGLERRIKPVRDSASESAGEIDEATGLLVDSLTESYSRILRALKNAI